MEIFKNLKSPSELEPSVEQNKPQDSERSEETASAFINTFHRLQEILSAVVKDSHSYKPANDEVKKYITTFLNISLPEENPKKGCELKEHVDQVVNHLLKSNTSEEKRLQTLHDIVEILEDKASIRKIQRTIDFSGLF